MKSRQRVLAFILALVFALTFTACGTSSGGASGAPAGTSPSAQASTQTANNSEAPAFKLGWVCGNGNAAFQLRVQNAMVEIGAENGIEVLVSDAKNDVTQEVNLIESYIAMGVNAVASAPRDRDGTAVAVDECWDANIPYISCFGEVNTDRIYAGSSEITAGRAQAQYLAEVLPENGKILYLTNNPTHANYIGRKEGLQLLFELRPDVEVLDEQNCQLKTDKAMEITENWIQLYSEFDAIVGQNDDCCIGAYEALKAADRIEGVTLVGIDGNENALISVQNGEMSATCYQDARTIAQHIIDVCLRIRDGEDPKNIPDQEVPFSLVTKENVDFYLDALRNNIAVLEE